MPESQARGAPQQSLWRLGSLTPGRLGKRVIAELRANHALGRASELAFDFLFALFPLILFMLTLFGLFASRSVELQQDLLTYFRDFLPSSAFQLLGKTTTELAASAGGGKLTFGIVVALWFASGGVSSLISGLNLANRIVERRSWPRVRVISVALTFCISLLLLTALFLVLVSGRFIDWMGSELGLQPLVLALWRALQWPAAIAFVLASFSLIYFWGPDWRERRWHWVSPGSAFGTLVWFLGSTGFRIYLRFFDSYSATYGSLGAVMILLAWLYLAALAFLIGGTIDAEIERRVRGEV